MFGGLGGGVELQVIQNRLVDGVPEAEMEEVEMLMENSWDPVEERTGTLATFSLYPES